MIIVLLSIILSLAPVLLFLCALVFLDSYKLVSLRSVLAALGIGILTAGCSYLINSSILQSALVSHEIVTGIIAPIIEETLKSMYVLYLFRRKKVGFIVDTAIYGAAIGAGFSVIENLYYIASIPDADFQLWIIRGFGTAIMHGGTTSVFGILSYSVFEKKESRRFIAIIPVLSIAIAFHSLFNLFTLNPFVKTIIVVMVIPLTIILAFSQSEKATRKWLEINFDTDIDVLRMLNSGNITSTHIGAYLSSLTSKFKNEIVADMLCYLRLHLELSIRAKGILMMREAGYTIKPDDEVRAQFAELNYLEKSIGHTGALALKPLLRLRNRDLWQLHMLKS